MGCQRTEDYGDYLVSRHWREFRAAYYRAHARQCWVCGSVEEVDLHHWTYATLGHEEFSDVVPLCHLCHDASHALVKAGTKLRNAHRVLKERFDTGKYTPAAPKRKRQKPAGKPRKPRVHGLPGMPNYHNLPVEEVEAYYAGTEMPRRVRNWVMSQKQAPSGKGKRAQKQQLAKKRGKERKEEAAQLWRQAQQPQPILRVKAGDSITVRNGERAIVEEVFPDTVAVHFFGEYGYRKGRVRNSEIAAVNGAPAKGGT